MLLLRPLVSGDGAGDIVEGRGDTPTPPVLGRCQQRGNKRETTVIRHGQGVLLIILRPLSLDTDLVTPLMAEEEDDPKKNPPTPRTWEVPTT